MASKTATAAAALATAAALKTAPKVPAANKVPAAATAPATGHLNDIISDVARAIRADEAAFFRAAMKVGFLGAYGQTFELKAGKAVNAAKFAASWDSFLKAYMASGNVAFMRPMVDRFGNHVLREDGKGGFKPRLEACADDAARIKAASSVEARNKIVNELWNRDTRPKGYRLLKGLNRIKTTAKAMTEAVCLNHSGWIAQMVALESAGADRKGLYAYFLTQASEAFGDNGGALESHFSSASAPVPFDAKAWAEKVLATIDEGTGKVPAEILAYLATEVTLRSARLTGLDAAASELLANGPAEGEAPAGEIDTDSDEADEGERAAA